jgi:hypothetical protein
MPTLAEIAERLAGTYWQLLARNDPALEVPLDALFDAIAELDAVVGGMSAQSVRDLVGDCPS